MFGIQAPRLVNGARAHWEPLAAKWGAAAREMLVTARRGAMESQRRPMPH